MSYLPTDYQIQSCNEQGSLKFNLGLENPEIKAHFPGQPIIAAYVQLNWLECFCKQIYKTRFKALRDIKFKSQITPPCEIEIVLNLNSQKFEIKVDAQIKTTGKIIVQ